MAWTVDIHDRIKLIQMSDEGPNAIDLNFLTHLEKEFELNGEYDGIILTGNGHFFSAGLNIVKLIDANRKEIKDVITTFSCTLKKVMTFPGPVIAVVNGHAVAGGCLLALSCDYRIGISGNYQMGINELVLGVDLPPIALVAIRKSIPPNYLFNVSVLGKLCSPEEAVSIGLLNELVDPGEAITSAYTKIGPMISSLRPFQRLKREKLMPELKNLENEYNFIDDFVKQWFSPNTQKKLQTAVNKLKKR